MPKATRSLGALVFAALTAACSSSVSIPAGAKISCQSAADCPSGLVCNRGRCADPNALDTTPPDLVPGSVVVSPRRVRAGQSFTMTFQVTEALEGTPLVSLALVPPVNLDCAPAAGSAWACSHAVTGQENGGAGGEVSIDVRMLDRAGNDTARSGVTTVALDFVPPVPVVAGVGYFPGPENPAPSVRRATAGTLVRVALSADERLSTAVAPSLRGVLGGAELRFDLVERGPGDNEASFEATVPPLQPDGTYALEVTWADEVGNVGTAIVPDAVIGVRTSPPTLVVNQDALVFVRSPWGNAASEDLGGYTIPAGPYFALEPSDALTSTPTLPEDSLLLAGSTAPSIVIVQSSADATALVLGVLRPDAAGRLPRQKLVSPDLAAVWLVGVDDAGNRSQPVQVAHAEWVATATPPTLGASPHRLLASGHASPTRTQPIAGQAVTPGEVAGTDTLAALVSAANPWMDQSQRGIAPAARSGHAMAYDGARGRAVLFGGSSYGTIAEDTWEWDGASWTQVATSGPIGRYGHAMAYDSARGRVVLFGGFGVVAGQYVYLGDTWEWDGAAWTQLATSGPPRRSDHAMAYDSVRGRVVLFGGRGPGSFQDTWEWDGSSWTQAATGGPDARYFHAMAYDCARGRMVLFGGFAGASGPPVRAQDTWEWDGASWSRVATGGPSARAYPAMAYDGAHGGVVLFGGSNSSGHLQDTWKWNGTSWTMVAASGPSARSGHALAAEGARGRLVLFGGVGIVTGQTTQFQDTWEWDGASWRRVGTGSPSARAHHAVAYDGARERVVLHGGSGVVAGQTALFQDTWSWDGDTWTAAAELGPGERMDHAMAYDAARERIVLFGGSRVVAGQTVLLGDTWEWDGASWTEVATNGPSARMEHAMAYDGVRGRVLMFGGSLGSPSDLLQDTWEWDGQSWTSVATEGPSARMDHAMAYDDTRGRVVLFGGSSAGLLEDTWEWDGQSWTSVATSGPSARMEHAMAYDGARGRVVVFGGMGVVPGQAVYLEDAWDFDGVSWTSLAAGGPRARNEHAMAYDAARGQLVLFGGIASATVLQDTWSWSPDPDHRPSISFEPSIAVFGSDPTRVTGLRVRAFAGGRFAPGGPSDVGATLLGWANRGPLGEPGVWVPLAANGSGVAASPPHLAGAGASLVSWQASSPEEARRFLVERDGLAFQVRPSGGAGAAPEGAQVALDYVEVRVRYAAP